MLRPVKDVLPRAEAALPGHRYRDLAGRQEGRAIHRVDQRGPSTSRRAISIATTRGACTTTTGFPTTGDSTPRGIARYHASNPCRTAKNLGYGEPVATAAPRALSPDRSGREKSRDSGPGSRRAPPPPPIPTEAGWPLSRGFSASVRARAAGRKSRGSAARPLRATFDRRSSRPPLCPLPVVLARFAISRDQPGSASW
jgi:hypothetical protein